MDVKLLDVLLRNKHPEDYKAVLDYFVTTPGWRFSFAALELRWGSLSETVSFAEAYQLELFEFWHDTYIKGTEYEGV